MPVSPHRRPIRWIGSSLDELRAFPKPVRTIIGVALNEAHLGGKHAAAKPLRGFHGAGVVEIFDDFDGDTFRAVYTVRFFGVVYVLHVFQKKSKKGIATPKANLDLIKLRLRYAERDYADLRSEMR
ncbi:MAG: type II toxin-antitoxin system RelE/ParE family toxin [Candidatus Binataceae bacterium]